MFWPFLILTRPSSGQTVAKEEYTKHIMLRAELKQI